MAAYPPEKVARFVALNADEEGSSSAERSAAFDQAYVFTPSVEEGPPPPSYDESVAAYGGPPVVDTKQPVNEKTVAIRVVQDAPAAIEKTDTRSLYPSVQSDITPFPFPTPQISGNPGARGRTPSFPAAPIAHLPLARHTSVSSTRSSLASTSYKDPSLARSASTGRGASGSAMPYAAPASACSTGKRNACRGTSASYTQPSACTSVSRTASACSRSSSTQHRPPSPSGSARSSQPRPLSPLGSIASGKSFPTSAVSLDSTANGAEGLGSYASPPNGPASSPFERPAPQELKHIPFPPCALFSLSENLEHGFPVFPPPSDADPHPFATHDVNASDWSQFLAEVKAAASPTSLDRVAPGIAVIGITAGFLVSKGIKAHLKKRKIANVAETADRWNYHFFYPRQMEVTFARGQERLSGLGGGPPPDTAAASGEGPYLARGKTVAYSVGSLSDEDRSSSEEEHNDTAKPGAWTGEKRQERQDAKRARKAERKTRRAEKRRMRRDGAEGGAASQRTDEDALWRLVVSYRQPLL